MGGREVSRPYRVWFFAEGEMYFSTEPIFGGNEILFIFVGCNLIGFSDDDTTMGFDFDGGGGWYGGWRG